MSEVELSFISMVESVVDNAKVMDMHTHLFAPELRIFTLIWCRRTANVLLSRV